MEEFPVNFRGEGRMNVGAWWEVPGAVAQTLNVSRREFSVTQGGPRPAATVSVQRQEGIVLLVDFGAQQTPSKTPFCFRMESGHLAWEELVSLFIGTSVPTVGFHTRPRPLPT